MSAAHASWLPRSTQCIPRVRMGGARLPLALLVVPTRCRLYLTVEKRQAEQGHVAYETLHGNELIGIKPGELGTKPTDHAYVLARLVVR